MIISGQNFRSLAERNELSFSAQLSINNTTGNVDLGFSGDGDSVKFQFSGSRMIDPEGRYFNSYLKDGSFTLSGNLESDKYDYYINDNLNCSVGVKNDFKVNKFFINTTECEANLNLRVYSSGQDYTLTHHNQTTDSPAINLDIKNNQQEEFTIFTGSVAGAGVSHPFYIDADVPSGKYDGTYIQDYKYYAGSGDLDECNGRFAITPEYPSGVYHYHVTDSWPYVMSCFKGKPATQDFVIGEIQTSGTNPTSGAPSPWLTGKFFDKQTEAPQDPFAFHVRQYTSGVSVDYSDEHSYVKSKGVPSHFYGPFSGNPNTVSQQDHIFRIPLVPVDNAVPEPIPMQKVGVAINGIPIDLLSDEYYKNKGRWRLAVHPNSGSFGLDKHNAHVQPNGTYHYHATPSGILDDYDFTTPTFSVTSVPSKYSAFTGAGFTKYSNSFGINIFATSGVADAKILHAANVIAEYLDNDLDGVPDNLDVANALVGNEASIIMTSGELRLVGMNYANEGVSGVDLSKLSGYHAVQDLMGTETNPNPSNPYQFDATLEEVLHLLTDYGWSEVYPYAFGTLSGSAVANAMDSGRGGHFEWCNTHRMPNGTTMAGPIHGTGQYCLDWGSVHDPYTFVNGKANGAYPSGSWFHYVDKRCDYSCQVSEYLYWGVTSILGAQTERRSLVSDEWEYVTPTGLKSGDPTFYNLITDPQYKLPTGYLPTGGYNPSASTTTSGSTGHSPILGYAFDGYPIYGPRGYTNTGVSGDVKVMESSYLPKNIDRENTYPKVIKQYNDLYLPYYVDLFNSGDMGTAGDLELEVTLNTNAGDFVHTIPVKNKTITLGGDPLTMGAQQGSSAGASQSNNY
jgi:hypothetical protein